MISERAMNGQKGKERKIRSIKVKLRQDRMDKRRKREKMMGAIFSWQGKKEQMSGMVNTLGKERTEVNVGQGQYVGQRENRGQCRTRTRTRTDDVRTFNKSNKEVNRVVIKGIK